MKITKAVGDAAALKELGARLARHRLNQGLSQEALAEEAGVSRNPVLRAERGESVQLTSLVRILRTLGLLDNLEAAIPEPGVSPMDLLKLRGKQRQRAPRRQAARPKRPWTWKDPV